VRYKHCIWLLVVTLGAVCSAAQRGTEGSAAGDQFVGTWSGTWDGAGTGGFELTLEKPKDGALGGRVSVTGEPTYKATLKTVAFDGSKMTATYDFPPDERAEISLTATFEDTTAKGTWLVREKASGGDVAGGTWSVKKK
jgi:hypothetical protein